MIEKLKEINLDSSKEYQDQMNDIFRMKLDELTDFCNSLEKCHCKIWDDGKSGYISKGCSIHDKNR